MLLPLLFVTSVSAQQLKGKIVDKDGIGIPFSSVILINKADSAFVAGAITKENGGFELTITSTPSFEQCLLQIRSIGYKSIYTDPRDELGEIVLQEDLQTLDEVVVSVERPKSTLENGKISVGVEHTVLENLGNATQTIAHLPFVSQTNDALTVFGRGTPLVYIDNRQVHGIEELTQLSSNEIKNIELILNPGVEYGSDVKSVIKVTTKKKEKD